MLSLASEHGELALSPQEPVRATGRETAFSMLVSTSAELGLFDGRMHNEDSELEVVEIGKVHVLVAVEEELAVVLSVMGTSLNGDPVVGTPL